MKRVPNPSYGRKFHGTNKAKDAADTIMVAESHHEHLMTAFPSLTEAISELQALDVPASFTTVPGAVTGRKLRKCGVVMTQCLMCGAEIPITSTLCPECAEVPKNSGGGNSWLKIRPAA